MNTNVLPWEKYAAEPSGPWDSYAGTQVPSIPSESEALANPPIAPTSAGLPIAPNTIATRRNAAAQPGITPAMRAANPVNQGVESTLKASPVVVGSMVAPELLPEMGLLGTSAAVAGGAGAGTSIGQGMTGQNPFTKPNLTQAGENAAIAGGSELLFGGAALGAKSLLRSGMFGDGIASYFAANPVGQFVPTNEMRDIQRIHEAIGVKSGDMNIGLGATTPQDAWNLPGRAIKEAGFKPQDFEGLNPFQQADKLKPAWQKAGQAVTDTAEKATKAGVHFDGAKSLTQAIGDMLDPEGSKALAMANDTAKQLGIKNWAKMTPNEAVELKQALWQRLPPRFRGPVYGALSRDLNTAVPEMVPVNRTYTEMRSAMDAIQDSAEKYMSRASPTWQQKMLELLQKHPTIAGATGLGGTISGGMGLYQGGKELYNLVTGK